MKKFEILTTDKRFSVECLVTKADPRVFFQCKKKRGGGPTVIENFSFENIWTSRKLNKCMNKLYSLFNHGLG